VFLALDAVNEVGARPAAENIRRANELEALRARQTAAPTTRLLRLSEATLRMGAGEPAMARTLADQVLQSEPRSCEARSIAVGASSGRAGRPGIVASFGAWCPWWADAYAERNWNDEDLLAFVRLTVQLSSPSPTYAPWLAYELLRRNRREEARGLASQLMQGAEARRKTGNYIMALVEADEGRVAAALRRLQDWLLGADVHAKDSTTELALVSALLLAEVLGADAEFADEFCQRFLLHDPPRVERGTPYLIVAQAAMRAPESVAFESLARVRELLDQGVFFGKGMGDEAYLQGALAFAQHDDRGAVKHWRQLAAVPAFQFSLRPEAFDRADEPELASAIDRFVVARPWRVGLAHVREARRAAKRGDTARARELAQQVIDKWATADAEIVHVKEMRALLANLAPK
jgi:hypothetical protein